jgi:hypothetical protein
MPKKTGNNKFHPGESKGKKTQMKSVFQCIFHWMSVLVKPLQESSHSFCFDTSISTQLTSNKTHICHPTKYVLRTALRDIT